MYKITKRQYENAKMLGVTIKPSRVKGKKIDVFDSDGNKIASIGALGYYDYDGYIKEMGLLFANRRRQLYKIRHESDRHKKGTPGYYADKILW